MIKNLREKYNYKFSDNDFVNSKIIIEDYNLPLDYFKDYKYKPEYICDICNEKYISPAPIRPQYSHFCKKHHFFYICDYCGRKFEIKYLGDFIQSNKSERFCSHNCTLQFRNRSQNQRNTVIEMNKARVHNNLSKIQICNKCGKEFNSIFPMNICNGCITSETNKNNIKNDQICNKCGKIFHSTFIMKIGPCCNPNIGGSFFNFITKNNVRYYKNKPVEKIIKRLDLGEYNVKDFPGWNKRFGEWYYKTENILTGEITKLNGSLFYEKNEELWYYDKEINNYIPWIEYKEKFLISSKNTELPENFKIIPTFRIQDSNNWSGARTAFEQSLIDDNISWFIYIKFYIDKNLNVKPLVCGKRGSLIVNSNGSDVSFDYDINGGPVRQFLIEENLEWDKTRIAILKCNSEKESYLAEQKYLKELNLFGS